MEKMVALRSLYRSVCSKSYRFASSTQHQLRRVPLRHYHHQYAVRSIFNLPSSSSVIDYPNQLLSECRSPLSMGTGNRRYYSEDVTHIPAIKDPELQNAFKDLMAASWDNLPDSVIHEVKAALSKSTDDKAGKEVVENVFRAAEAVEEFGGILVTLKMEIDDSIGLSGENVKPLPDHVSSALNTAYDRYIAYLDAFTPDETYLRKKVETELGTKMIHLKMRCSNLGSEWGKVSVLGTSGLSGSYVEQRA
ncbi:succinate dehydrogenase subunit 5, mitochondrial-like [Quillaja saponaria]|uniref:Succinate dehydrogenase subunit 5, mitochondrial-like n=1 Tax=Quillaja saponaria TaxID=32244 RepID=A0AAD7PK60_QUISA|nr:succinate dehydrogenase subunit 5, mitochondrial-like [Quillaja saponaria]